MLKHLTTPLISPRANIKKPLMPNTKLFKINANNKSRKLVRKSSNGEPQSIITISKDGSLTQRSNPVILKQSKSSNNLKVSKKKTKSLIKDLRIDSFNTGDSSQKIFFFSNNNNNGQSNSVFNSNNNVSQTQSIFNSTGNTKNTLFNNTQPQNTNQQQKSIFAPNNTNTTNSIFTQPNNTGSGIFGANTNLQQNNTVAFQPGLIQPQQQMNNEPPVENNNNVMINNDGKTFEDEVNTQFGLTPII